MTTSLTTNIIRNVYNIGTGSCDAGTQYCSDGYALYFPCLKDITKGQDVCFDFYVADYAGRNEYLLNAANTGDGTNPDGTDGTGDNGSGKELADLRDVDAISLNLIGMFNCPYGTFSYPDNISSLQTEEYPVAYSDDFGERTLCHLDVIMMDMESDDSEALNGKSGDFYSGTEVEVAAYDTPTHIFVGWAILDTDTEECPDETWSDYIISTNNIYRFVIKSDIILFAIYRKRKIYSVVSDSTNKYSMFIVDYNHVKYNVSNRDNEVFDETENNVSGIPVDKVDNVLEGYHMVATCVPSTDKIGDGVDMSYKFVEWKDNETSRCRDFIVGYDTTIFESENVIKLKAKCTGPFTDYEEPDVDDIFYIDEFDEEGIHINTEFNEVTIYDYYGDCNYVMSANDVYQQFIGENGYLYFNNGTLVLYSKGIMDGIKINVHAKTYTEDDDCDMNVTVNGYTSTISLSKTEFKLYEFYFRKCEGKNIEITTDGECLIDMIEICKEEIIDKGKAQLCLPAEVTANLPSGTLSVNGAIMVNGQSYGLATTQIGTVNKLPTITINI